MTNVKPGDIAYYIGSSDEIGPKYGQFCKVLGPAKKTYALIGCCGLHGVAATPKIFDKLIWEVEWSTRVDMGDSPSGFPLHLTVGPCLDIDLRRIDGGITQKDIDKEIELDKQSTREKEIATSGPRAALQWFAEVLSLGIAVFVGLLRAVGNLIIEDAVSGGAKPRRANAHVRVEPRMKGEA